MDQEKAERLNNILKDVLTPLLERLDKMELAVKGIEDRQEEIMQLLKNK
ncbi:hypothetical protein [Heyndrickxia ginsengihumi]|uniref:Uncharacterized protein n=1 Tax=Heyndrickxia ginsengihumi TaxID=363870 RepID=A0A6M0PA77_9BACI|nr:hypothetical protein [Heyndrickxia ginsengihumi]MCM3023994.1 hypothetical protein [Heyndrickxia ginsengihumi]NEY21255.1 hypothetical protein [Heyndrickxia ginsengihumi]